MEQLDAITIKHVKESFAGTFSNQNLFVDAPVRSLKAALFSLAEFVDWVWPVVDGLHPGTDVGRRSRFNSQQLFGAPIDFVQPAATSRQVRYDLLQVVR